MKKEKEKKKGMNIVRTRKSLRRINQTLKKREIKIMIMIRKRLQI